GTARTIRAAATSDRRASELYVKGLAAILSLLAAPAWAVCDGRVGTRVIPLPIYATLPNEGSTYGFMPVIMRVCEETGRTESIVAPSVSYNDTIHWTGT